LESGSERALAGGEHFGEKVVQQFRNDGFGAGVIHTRNEAELLIALHGVGG
jgi:hypothetical protein